MRFRRARLCARDEASTNPHTLGTPHEVRGEAPPVVNRAGTDDVHGFTGERGLVTFDGVDAGGDEDGGGDVAGVSAAFTALGADEVDAGFERSGDVLRVADHLEAGLVSK